MHRRALVVAEAQRGLRVDRFLCEALPGLGRAAARRLCESGEVRCRGKRLARGARVAAGDELSVPACVDERAPVPDASLPLCVAYEDAELLVVDKPAGMACHPLRAGERGTLASALLARHPELAQVGGSAREPGLVHRLDTDTSGLLLVARTQPVFLALRGALRAGAIDKRYRALAAGRMLAPARHHGYLRAHGAKVRVRAEPFADAVPITTEVLASAPRGELSAVEVRAVVARRHQVRAQLAALGHPLAGDALYGGPPLPGLARHFLHASALALRHPGSGRELRVESELPPELAAIERALSA